MERSTGFERVLATGTVDVVGVDPGRAEGITGFKKACDRVETYRRQANAHAWSSAIVHRREPRDLVQLAGVQALRGQAAAEPDAARPRHRARSSTSTAGSYPPTGIGLGIEVIDEVVDRYRSEVVLA